MRPTELANLSDIGVLDDDRIDLARTCLRIALLEYPRLDVEAQMAELDRLAERARALDWNAVAPGPLAGVDAALFEEARFRGNVDRYYDPRNSFLNEVLRRRTGIPITLSIVYIEVAHRLGLQVDGVAFPGHFFVVFRTDFGPVYIDPFAGGARLDQAARRTLARRALPEGRDLTPELLRPTPRRAILVRVLRNLLTIYVRARDDARTVAVLDRILQISPRDLEALKERGEARLRQGDYVSAVADLERYLASAPPGPRHTAVTELIASARRSQSAWN